MYVCLIFKNKEWLLSIDIYLFNLFQIRLHKPHWGWSSNDAQYLYQRIRILVQSQENSYLSDKELWKKILLGNLGFKSPYWKTPWNASWRIFWEVHEKLRGHEMFPSRPRHVREEAVYGAGATGLEDQPVWIPVLLVQSNIRPGQILRRASEEYSQHIQTRLQGELRLQPLPQGSAELPAVQVQPKRVPSWPGME